MADTRGLFLLVTRAGGKLWRWKYRFEGQEKEMSFGQYPEVTLAEVRALHAEARRLLTSGIDPMEQRKAERSAVRESNELAFRLIASQWHEHWKDGNSPHHVRATWSRLEANVFPAIGDRLITKIEAPEIVSMVKAIQDRGKLDIAKRALETTGQIFRYAVAHGLTKRNPASEIKPGDILKSRQNSKPCPCGCKGASRTAESD
ncbi:MAG TPA: integrase arm-type DNA-binding domain-containing protein [Edaphobacter sp.]|nr:integrase arm-type DNA-binding domain-containing protein [Edaphobacter sp.]